MAQLRIPQTNILLVSTSTFSYHGASIVYYLDLSTSGEVIQVIKSDENIYQMIFVKKQESILIINITKIILVNPYTLQPQKQILCQGQREIILIPNTEYAIITMLFNEIRIIDLLKFEIVKIFSNSDFPRVYKINQYNSYFFTLKDSTQIIMTSNENGIITWTINMENLEAEYNGYITELDTQNVYGLYENYRRLAKHPTEDIFFFSGYYEELIIMKFINFKEKVFITMFNGSNIFSDFQYNINNPYEIVPTDNEGKPVQQVDIFYRILSIDGIDTPSLLIIDDSYSNIYPIVLEDNVAIIEAINNPTRQYIELHYKHVYAIEEIDNLFSIPTDYYVTLYDTKKDTVIYYLYFPTNYYQRRLIFQVTIEGEYLELYLTNTRTNRYLALLKRSYTGDFYRWVYPRLLKPAMTIRNSLCRVKLCELCVFHRIGSGQDHYIQTFLLYPWDSDPINRNLNQYSLNWNQINTNLDPFFRDEHIYVVFGFPYQTYSPTDYLFLLVNASTGDSIQLKVGPDDPQNLNSNQSSFAMISVEFLENQEIIGIDLIGNIYVWDFKDYSFKFSRHIDNCHKAEIGDIFHYQDKKWLLIVCDDYIPRIYDFSKNETVILSEVKLYSMPLALKAYSDPGVFLISDQFIGNTFVYKFNEDSLDFSFLIKLSKGMNQESVLGIEILKEKVLWIQYEESNFFFDLLVCIKDVSVCLKCSKTYYFQDNQTYDSDSIYGLGTVDSPFTSSMNYYTAMLKAQFYSEFVNEVEQIEINIIIDPSYPIKLHQGLLNCTFSSLVALNILKSSINSDNQEQLSLNLDSSLSFSGYQLVTLKGLNLNFAESLSDQCGIRFESILQKAIISQTQINRAKCFNIIANSTSIEIDSVEIDGYDLSSSGPIFQLFDSNQLNLTRFTLNGVILGKDTAIVSSGSQLQLSLNNFKILNSQCSESALMPNNQSSSIPLFSAGLISINELEIMNNTFCKKNIFFTTTSLDHSDLQFNFSNIIIKENTFQVTSKQIFFHVLYYQLVIPQHGLILKNVTYESNTIFQIKDDKYNLAQAKMIIVDKIETISLDDVFNTNQNSISLGIFEDVKVMTIQNLDCNNDDKTFSEISEQLPIGCFQILEVADLQITNLKVEKRITQDFPLISIVNTDTTNSKIIIDQSQFINLIINQNTDNSIASPLLVQSKNYLNLTISNCTFSTNKLNGKKSSFTYSTNALWVQNYIGAVNIDNSFFLDSESNSKYNFIYISSKDISVTNSVFSEQSYSSDISDYTNIQGGFLFLEIENLKIQHCSFEKSKAGIGSFIYSTAFSSAITVNIDETSFEDGLATTDGGAVFFELATSHLTLECNNSSFKNLTTLNLYSSIFAFQQSTKQTKLLHEVGFENGKIQNWVGNRDSFFSTFKYFNFKMSNFNSITHVGILPEPFSQNLDSPEESEQTLSQGSLFSAESSNIVLENIIIHNLQQQSNLAYYPIIISATDCDIQMRDVHFSDSTFNRAGIEVSGGSISIESSEFRNINQESIQNMRILEANDQNKIIESVPIDSYASLIIVFGSTFTVNGTSQFENINCSDSCNGSALQLRTPKSFSISGANFTDSQASFGGSIFVSGLTGINTISNSSFSKNSAFYSGGSIFITAQESNVFTLTITDSNFSKNTAINGKGGAIFIRSDIQNDDSQSINIVDSNIIHNVAQVGGSIYVKDISPTITGTNISLNKGKVFGSNLVSYPAKLKLVLHKILEPPTSHLEPSQSGYDLVLNQFQSGADFPVLSFEMVTDNDEVIIPLPSEENTFAVTVSLNSTQNDMKNYNIRGQTKIKYQKNVGFMFSGLQLVGVPETQATLHFESNQIFVVNPETKLYENTYSFKVLVYFRNCQPGEKFNKYSDFTECTTCASGYYSYDMKQCYNCPTGATCSGGSQFQINPGYWRKSENSEIVLPCSNSEQNCQGGNYGQSTCFEGHIGALCEECDIFAEYNLESYSKSGKYSCTNCSQISQNFLIVACLTIWTLISMVLAIKGDVTSLENKAAAQTLERKLSRRREVDSELPKSFRKKQLSIIDPKILSISTDISNSRKITRRKTNPYSTQIEGAQAGIFIKMLTNYIQIVGSISTFNLQIPSGIVEIPSQIGQPLQSSLNSIDCVLKDLSSTIPMIYLRLIFSQVIPFIYLLLFILGLVIQYKLLSKTKRAIPFYVISTACIFLVIFVQSDLVAQSIALISCREIGGIYYILSNVAYECFSDDYNTYTSTLVAPILFIWVIVLPFSLLLLLKRNQKKLQNTFVKLSYGFLYKEYKDNAYYWEFIKMAEKLAIVLSLNFYSQSIVMKGILVFIIITIYGIFAMMKEPYKESIVNSLDVLSTNTCAITVLLGIFIYKNQFDYFIYPAFILIIIMNMWYLISMFKQIIPAYLQKYNELFIQCAGLLAKKYPLFQRFLPEKKKQINIQLKQKAQVLFKKLLELPAEQKKSIYVDLCLKDLELKHSKQISGEKEGKQIKVVESNNLDDNQCISPLQIPMVNSIDEFSQPTEMFNDLETKSMGYRQKGFTSPNQLIQSELLESNFLKIEIKSENNPNLSKRESKEKSQSVNSFEQFVKNEGSIK